MSRTFLLLFAVLAAGCPPPAVEPHQAAAALREKPSYIGTISRQELESEITDPDSHVGTAATPEPRADGMTVSVIGTVQSKLCFSVEAAVDANGNPNEQHASFGLKMRSAGWSVHALPRDAYSYPTPWPDPSPAESVMLKMNTKDEAIGRGLLRAVVCLPSPRFAKDSRVLALTMKWETHDQKLVLWDLTK